MRTAAVAAAAAAATLAVVLSPDARGALISHVAPTAWCSLAPADEFVLAGQRVVLSAESGDHPALPSIVPAALLIRGGTIAAVIPLSPSAAASDLGAAASLATGRRPGPGLRLAPHGSVIAPAAVDTHVHANDPGHRAGWEGLASATRAAAAGGVGTLVDMPLNSHPSATTGRVVRRKARSARWLRPLAVDVGFWGGLVPANAHPPHAELAAMVGAGVLGFKAFLAPSGIADFPNASLADVRAALPFLMRAGLPLLVHAELVSDGGGSAAAAAPPPHDLATWEASRPPTWEVDAVAGLIAVLREAVGGAGSAAAGPGFRLHVAHVGTPDALPLLAAAQEAGLPITGEAVPHALGGLPYPSASPPPPADRLWKCAPPLRGREGAAAGLWGGLLGGALATIGSDHSPAPPGLKAGAPSFASAWGGVSGLQFSLPAAWTAASRHAPAPVTPAHMAAWMAASPADLAGLGGRKGCISPGADADLVVWDPGAPADTAPSSCHQRHPAACPYVGSALMGRVLATYVRGRLVFEAGGGPGGGGRFARAACGRVVRRNDEGGGGGAATPRAGLAGSAAAAAAAG